VELDAAGLHLDVGLERCRLHPPDEEQRTEGCREQEALEHPINFWVMWAPRSSHNRRSSPVEAEVLVASRPIWVGRSASPCQRRSPAMIQTLEQRLSDLESSVENLVQRAEADEVAKRRAGRVRIGLLLIVAIFYTLYLKQALSI
jgi:hypothetical protein